MKTFAICAYVSSILIVVLGSPFGIPCILTGNSIENINLVKLYCNTIVVEDLLVPAGQTLDFSGIAEVNVIFRGNISFEYEEWKGPLILFSGYNINVTGEYAVIDGGGERWWDGLGSNGGVTKPRLFKFRNVIGGSVSNLYFHNSPRHCFAIHNCTDVLVSNITIDNADGDLLGGHNTDGFNVKGSENAVIADVNVYNQDDCLAVRSGNNVHFLRGHCSGGHGLSIGSVGNRTNNIVENIYITDSEVVNSENGIRIKTVYNYTGLVQGVHFDNITLANITTYGILIRGDYLNLPAPTGTPTDGIPINNLTITNIRGTVQKNGTNIFVLVADEAASYWDWENITVTGGENKQLCSGIPIGSNAFCVNNN